MSKLLKVTLLLALAVGFFGAYRYGAAQETESSKGKLRLSPPSFDVNISQDPDALATKHLLEGTYNNTGVAGALFPADAYTPIGAPLTVSCPGTTGTCTIQADMWIETAADRTGETAIYAVCLYVDGNPAPCYTAGETLPDGQSTMNSTSQGVSNLTHGNHTVQTYFYTTDVVYVDYYNSNYRVYKP